MFLKLVPRKKNLSPNNKLLLTQFQHALKSPEHFQTFLHSLEEGNTPWFPRKPAKRWKKVRQRIKDFLTAFHLLYFEPPEEARSFLNVFLQSFFMIALRDLLKNAGFRLIIVPIREILDHYPHSSSNVPEHAKQLVAEGSIQEAKASKTGGVVFDSSQVRPFIDALTDPNHQHRQRAVQLVRRFNAAIEKEKAQPQIQERGIMVKEASQKYGVSESTLRDWWVMGFIPVLYKGKGKQGVYLDEATVARAAAIDQKAKQQGIQSIRLLKAELDQQAAERPHLDRGITARSASREFNVPTNFLLRWAKKEGIIPIISEGTGVSSATYLDREKAKEAAELYHEAKRQKIQPIKLYQRMSAG
jgi:DNA-binding transcriptional MerR regulator